MGYIESLRSEVGSRPLILVACAVFILDEQNRILLQLREDTRNWGVPGGFMELGETTEETAQREAYEETGLTVTDLKRFEVFSGKDFYFEYPNGDRVYNVIVAYKAGHVTGTLRTGEESLKLDYQPLSSLPASMIPTSRIMLERFRASSSF